MITGKKRKKKDLSEQEKDHFREMEMQKNHFFYKRFLKELYAQLKGEL